jgi:hypothetical protein
MSSLETQFRLNVVQCCSSGFMTHSSWLCVSINGSPFVTQATYEQLRSPLLSQHFHPYVFAILNKNNQRRQFQCMNTMRVIIISFQVNNSLQLLSFILRAPEKAGSVVAHPIITISCLSGVTLSWRLITLCGMKNKRFLNSKNTRMRPTQCCHVLGPSSCGTFVLCHVSSVVC